MKKTILLSILILAVCGLYAQNRQDYFVEEKVNNTINPIAKTTNTDGTLSLTFDDNELQTFLDSKQVYEYKKAFPGATTPRLQRTYLVTLDDETYLNDLASLNSVENVELVPEYVPLFDPNDYVETITGYGHSSKEQLDLIHASEAWDITTGSNLQVGVVDYKYTYHDDVNDNVIYYETGGGTTQWHGIFVMGCIAAETNNNLGIASIGFNTKIVAKEGLGYSRMWDLYQRTISGEFDIKVINNSWGHCSYSTYGNDVCEEIWDYGITLVCAAGNGTVGYSCGSDQMGYMYPASYDKTISVSSVGHMFNHGSPPYGEHNRHNWKDVHEFRMTEPIQMHTHNDKVDICAPGYDVTSTANYNTYSKSSGTSFASPIVAGICSLILSSCPDLTPDDVRSILLNTADDIYWIPENQPYIGLLGSGRVNAYRAVKEVKCLCDNNSDPDLDLYIRDSHEDLAVEPNNVSGNVLWHSPDIWVRNDADGRYIHEHENPEYDPNGNSYVYVRVRNTSCATSVSGNQLHLYWSKAGTNLSWPHHWNGSTYMYNPYLDQDVLMGAPIATMDIPELSPGQETILEIPWEVPDPYLYRGINDNIWHFCLLSRIESIKDPMTFTETENLPDNVRNNNNIAWKNTSIVDIESNNNDDSLRGAVIAVGNPTDQTQAFSLELLQDNNETGKAIFDEAEVGIEMDAIIYDAWEAGGKLSSNIKDTGVDNKKIVENDNVLLDNIVLEPHETGTVFISFNFLTKEITEKNEYVYHVIQRNTTTNQIIGGETYIVRKKPRDLFTADAGSDQEVDKYEPVTISADDIGEDAIYNWYDPDGNLIYTGKDITLTPDITKTYKLEIISDTDGFKDYDEIEVKVNPYAIDNMSPNPAQDEVTIEYKAQEATSAYIMIISTTNGNTDNYILDTTETEIIIDTTGLTPGLYHISLVCDGELVDTKNLIIE